MIFKGTLAYVSSTTGRYYFLQLKMLFVTKTFLYGDPSLSTSDNQTIICATLDYIDKIVIILNLSCPRPRAFVYFFNISVFFAVSLEQNFGRDAPRRINFTFSHWG